MEEGLICGFLQGLSPHKSVGPAGMHLSELGEVADSVTDPLTVIFEQ